MVEGVRLSFEQVGGNGFRGSGSMSLNRLGNCRLGLRVHRIASGKELLCSHGSEPDAESPGRSILVCKDHQSHDWTSWSISALTPDTDVSPVLAQASCGPTSSIMSDPGS